MEMFELKYFLAVAQVENVNKAAKNIHVSPGSLSKAIARLESELHTFLFFRSGRSIKLTPEGLLLKKKASHILQLEEDARLELVGSELGSLSIYISSEEILQTKYGIEILKKIENLYPLAKIQFLVRTDAQAVEQVICGDAHMAILTSEPPSELTTRTLARVDFKACASKSHPLVKKYGSKTIPVEEVLKYPFVSPDSTLLGKITKSNSIDGWRDIKLPRQIKYKVGGLKMIESLISEGHALGYVPDFFADSCHFIPLNVSGCPYTCQQTVRLVCKDPKRLDWLSQFWKSL